MISKNNYVLINRFNIQTYVNDISEEENKKIK
jgi:hypothetical protein